MFALLKSGTLDAYPVGRYELRERFRASIPNNILNFEFEDYSVIEVVETVKPSADVVTEADPVFIDGTLTQQWTTRSYNEMELAEILSKRRADIASEAYIDFFNPVASNGYEWNGGIDSSLKLDGAIRIAEQIGHTTATIHDITNTPRTLTIAEAKEVVVAVGIAYQTKFAEMQRAKRELDAINLSDEDSLSQINSVTYAP